MDIRILSHRRFFTAQDVARAQGITLASAHVLCSRYVRKGLFIRLKKNFFVLEQNWERYGPREFFEISNFLQVPSYVSCMSALSHYGLTTQVQQNWYENVTTRRTVSRTVRGVSFVYYRVKPPFYGGFVRDSGLFVALPEKALIDAVYLATLKGFTLDWDSLNLEPLDRARLSELIGPFPQNIKSRIASRCSI